MWMLDTDRRTLLDESGRRFDPVRRTWAAAGPPSGMTALDDAAALRWLQRESGSPCRPPVGVIGPREPTPAQYALAEAIGAGLAGLGLTVLCGGCAGVMEAVCRGVAGAGGLSIGLLPGEDWDGANAFVGVPVATGIGVARNAIIARAALCLIAVGGSNGTLSEIAYGLQFGKPVFALAGAPRVAGTVELEGWEDLLPRLARVVLNHPG
ncbi:MAG TPA: TIGR00725 family protein [Azospirillum sp.]|nr:TIGR00725 family protein [Azospirillum sp.]